jgi:hypothetical protein
MVAAFGCGDPQAEQPTGDLSPAQLAIRSVPLDSAVVVRDSAGIEIVESRRPIADSLPWRVTREPLVRIGVVEGEAAYQFHDIVGAVRLSDGRIVVLDGESAELRFFDGRGMHLRTVAGKGGGPGELTRPSHLQRSAGDTLVVHHYPLGTVSVFDPLGDFVRRRMGDTEALLRQLGAKHATEQFEPLPDGSLVLLLTLREQFAERPPPGVAYRPPMSLLRVPADFHERQSLGDDYGGLLQFYIETGGRRLYEVLPVFTHASVAASESPLRIFAGNGDRYEVRVFDSDGRLVRLIRRMDPPVPVDDAYWDSALRRRREQAQGPRSGDRMRVIEAMPRPAHFPAFGGLAADSEGALFVFGQVDGWNVFDPAGRWLGELPIWYQTFLDIGPDYLLALARDSLGVESVVLHGIER